MQFNGCRYVFFFMNIQKNIIYTHFECNTVCKETLHTKRPNELAVENILHPSCSMTGCWLHFAEGISLQSRHNDVIISPRNIFFKRGHCLLEYISGLNLRIVNLNTGAIECKRHLYSLTTYFDLPVSN